MKKALIIFDPYTSINSLYDYLPSDIALIGAITPNNNLELIFNTRINKAHFLELLILTGNLEADYDIVKNISSKYQDVLYLTGSELFNFQYIEGLIDKLSTFTNKVPSLSRYSKMEMQRTLADNGFPSIKSCIINSDEIDNVQKNVTNYNFPVIVRPNQDSVSGLGLKICNNLKEVVEACKEIMTIPNIAGNLHNKVLVQEYISGNEFVVDVSSLNRRHLVSGCFFYKQDIINNVPIKLYCELVTDANLLSQLKMYATGILDVLGVNTGFSHLEIMYYNGQFFLIELNPRLSGAFGNINKLSELINNSSQPKTLFKSLGYTYSDKPLYKYGRLIFLQNFGFRYDFVDEAKITGIPSYYSHTLVLKQCSKLTGGPRNIKDIVAHIILVDNDFDRFMESCDMVEFFEKSGSIYKLGVK